MTTEHLLQACPLHDNLGRQLWPVEIDSGGEAALDNLDHLAYTAAWTIWSTRQSRQLKYTAAGQPEVQPGQPEVHSSLDK